MEASSVVQSWVRHPVIRCVAATLDSIVEGRHSLLVFGFGPEFHQSSDRFGARWEIALAPAPVVDHPQKTLGYPHLKWAILDASRWAATMATIADHYRILCI